MNEVLSSQNNGVLHNVWTCTIGDSSSGINLIQRPKKKKGVLEEDGIKAVFSLLKITMGLGKFKCR
jgi:hypothetical protein